MIFYSWESDPCLFPDEGHRPAHSKSLLLAGKVFFPCFFRFRNISLKVLRFASHEVFLVLGAVFKQDFAFGRQPFKVIYAGTGFQMDRSLVAQDLTAQGALSHLAVGHEDMPLRIQKDDFAACIRAGFHKERKRLDLLGLSEKLQDHICTVDAKIFQSTGLHLRIKDIRERLMRGIFQIPKVPLIFGRIL